MPRCCGWFPIACCSSRCTPWAGARCCARSIRGEAGFGYVLWVTTVREAVDRLLPVASVGGSVVGVRLLRWRGLRDGPGQRHGHRRDPADADRALPVRRAGDRDPAVTPAPAAVIATCIAVLAFSLPMPLGSLLLLRYGSVFQRLERFLGPLVGLTGARCRRHRWMRICAPAWAACRTLLLAGALRVRAAGLRGLRDLVGAAPVRPSGQRRRRGHARGPDPGAAAPRLHRARGPGRAGGALVLFGHAWESAPNWRWRSRRSSGCAKCCAACRRCCRGNGSKRAELSALHASWAVTLGGHARATRSRNHPSRP